jgi:hypothetical protein
MALKNMTAAEQKVWIAKECELLDIEINSFIAKHPANTIKFIYGGKTEKTLKVRLEEHKANDINFKGAKSHLVKNYPELKEYKHKIGQILISKLEKHLIKKLKETYTTTVYNKNVGGGGGQNDVGDLQRLYIMYKKK